MGVYTYKRVCGRLGGPAIHPPLAAPQQTCLLRHTDMSALCHKRPDAIRQQSSFCNLGLVGSFVIVYTKKRDAAIYTYMLGSSARFARAEAYTIILWNYITG